MMKATKLYNFFPSCLPHSGKGEQAKEDGVQEIVSDVRPHGKGPVLFLPAGLTRPICAGMKNKESNKMGEKINKYYNHPLKPKGS